MKRNKTFDNLIKSSELRILFVSMKKKQNFGTVQMRCLNAIKLLNSVANANFRHFTEINLLQLPSMVVFHRLKGLRSVRYLRLSLFHLGVPVIYDTDDLIFEGHYSADNSGSLEVIKSCDGITVSSEYLAKKLSIHHESCCVIPNLSIWDYLSKPCYNGVKGTQFNLLFASGSNTHDQDFLIVIDELKRVLAEFKNITLYVVGKIKLPDDFKILDGSLVVLPFLTYAEYHQLLDNIDVILIPLKDTEFNKARSEIKYVEAAQHDVAVITSPVSSIANVVEHEFNGLICKEDEWYEGILKLYLSQDFRKHITKNAKNFVNREYTEHRILGLYLSFYGSVYDSFRFRKSILKGIYYYFLYLLFSNTRRMKLFLFKS